MGKIDFLAIGDTAIDDFIRLKDARVNCDINDENCTITMRFADKIPFESSTVVYGVGNAANAAVAAARLGFASGLVTNIGDDDRGDQVIEHFEKEGVDLKFATRHKNSPTNYHYVLWYESDRTILVNHYRYPYAFPEGLGEPKTVYLSSLGEGTEKYHEALADWLDAHPNISFVFQPGTFQMKLGVEKLSRLYKRANLFFANKEEYQRILNVRTSDVPILLKEMREKGPKLPFLTDGRKGTYVLNESGEVEHREMFPDPAPPFSRTGAGDAFSSTTTAYLAMGYSLKDAMLRGTINAAYVVQKVGAQEGLLTKAELESKLT